MEGAKKEVGDKVSQIKIKAHQQMEMLKRKTVIQAEDTRKTAASAAWWLTPAVTSAGGGDVGWYHLMECEVCIVRYPSIKRLSRAFRNPLCFLK